MQILCHFIRDLSICDFGICERSGTNPPWVPRDNLNYMPGYVYVLRVPFGINYTKNLN